MGSHHLEYGFPSTHSTNSVSIALFLFAHVYNLAYPTSPTTAPAISLTLFTILTIFLGFYAFSIVFGRLYAAMHSFTDCAMGVVLGTGIWWAYSSWEGIPITLAIPGPLHFYFASSSYTVYLGRGLGLGKWLWDWAMGGGWEVPLILVPLCLLLVNQHPQPVDDCPCFEDAIAFASVLFGALVGRWAVSNSSFGPIVKRGLVMPGSGWIFDPASSMWMQVDRGWTDVLVWWSVAALKMTIGNSLLIFFISVPIRLTTFALRYPRNLHLASPR